MGLGYTMFEIRMLDLVSNLNWTSIFVWCVTNNGSKRRQHKEIRLHAQDLLPILDLINNIIRGTYITFIIEPKKY